MTADACHGCGSERARVYLGEVPLCDRCADKRISQLTGFPELPDPPPPIALRDGHGRTRRLAFRVWRAPTGIEVAVEEIGVPPGEGYERAVLGAHDAEVAALVARLREIATDEVARRYLEPNPHRDGWLVVDDEVEGSLIWSDNGSEVGTPYSVVIDGRVLSWEELGRALEPYEGWRFRLEITDRIEDLRPDADVIALEPPVNDREPGEAVPTVTIDELLAAFLDDQRERLASRTYSRYEDVVSLLRSCLNNYGHQVLDSADQARFEAAYESDEEAFVHLFGPEQLVAGLPEFLGYFMIRKVMAGEELLRAAGTVTKRLAKWLEERGYLDSVAAAEVKERGAEASRDLPRAERLSSMLFDQAREATIDLAALDDDDVVEDYLMIERIEPGRLWFEGGIGPVTVPKAASDLAQIGWSVTVTLARVKNAWTIVETGNVYP